MQNMHQHDRGPLAHTSEAGDFRLACTRLSLDTELELIYAARLEHLVEVREPLVLISPVHRSGGTLLNRLLQDHPCCHVHAHELKIGHPHDRDWPTLDLTQPAEWFPTLAEKYLARHLRLGYRKWDSAQVAGERMSSPFIFVSGLQRSIFDSCVAERRIETQREVLDCYFTSYFNAWLDNHNLYRGPKRVVGAHAPRLAMDLDNVERFLADYPDGTLVVIVREPGGWYHSVQARYPKKIRTVDESTLAPWLQSVRAAIDAHARWTASVVLLTYEQLLLRTEPTMRWFAERIGIPFDPILLAPTFNGHVVRANSSAATDRTGVLQERAAAYRRALSEDQLVEIETLAGDLYERAVALTPRRLREG
jgi:Sulfotransferase family